MRHTTPVPGHGFGLSVIVMMPKSATYRAVPAGIESDGERPFQTASAEPRSRTVRRALVDGKFVDHTGLNVDANHLESDRRPHLAGWARLIAELSDKGFALVAKLIVA
jgi:hypothetical protein